MSRRLLRAAGALLGVILVGLVMAFMTLDRWFLAVVHPGEFDPAATPPAPDYTRDAAWAALPGVEDPSDATIEGFPAVDPATAPADVFYVHPTTWLGAAWNAAWDDPSVARATAIGGTLIQASAFNGCCAVYGPEYRQANGNAFVHPDAVSARALDVAFSDVSAAFAEFQRRRGAERPFLLVSHSQGTVLAARLLREVVAGTPAADRLVAAWLVGGPLHAEDLGGFPPCRAATDTGCVVTFNARGPRYRGGRLEFANPTATADNPSAGWVCTNPVAWETGQAPKAAHGGAVFLDMPDPKVIPAFAATRCHDGRLELTDMEAAPRAPASRVLDFVTGPDVYHPMEYQLFWVDLRRNAGERVAAFG